MFSAFCDRQAKTPMVLTWIRRIWRALRSIPMVCIAIQDLGQHARCNRMAWPPLA